MAVVATQQQALEWFIKAAEQADTDAQLRLGKLYDEGTIGGNKDHALAATWYRKAAEKGRSEAIVAIGIIPLT